jgi:hypothetical protein
MVTCLLNTVSVEMKTKLSNEYIKEFFIILHIYLLYIICRICNKHILLISTGSWMSYAQWRSHILVYIHIFFLLLLLLRYHFNSCIGVSERVRTLYLFSLCVVSLLSSRFTASALVWFYNFLKYLVFHFFFLTEYCVHLHLRLHLFVPSYNVFNVNKLIIIF